VLPTIRVASVPAQHVYVRHLSDPDGADAVARLSDPPPQDSAPLVGQWWPPAMLSLDWIDAHAEEFDVFHVQFGFDAQDPANLASIADELARLHKPLVYTVHDLRNPHHLSPAAHDAHLDVLVQRADELITLTPGAAEVIGRAWGRRPVVVPHPHVLDLARIARTRPSHDGFVVGVHVKSLRASMAPLPVIQGVRRAIRDLPDARLVVDVHHDVFDPEGSRHDAELTGYLCRAADDHEIELHVHDCYSDDELWDYLEGLDLSVLPYRFGTHSGWLEACFDLGTAVLAPDCGYFAEQHPCLQYSHDENGMDSASLEAAVRHAWERRPGWRAEAGRRRQERAEIAAAHRVIYERALA